ncbi:TIGR02452 family protein [Nannocystaceae bacterium ST9]
MSLRGVAQQTLEILEQGGYSASDGSFVELAADVEAAVAGTLLYTPRQLDALLRGREGGGARARIEVTGELTQEAARRLIHDEGCEDLVLLNFASAKNAGGGFINGAKAQEEDLARASALYPCLLEAREYYEANRNCDHLVYTDHMIWSPAVPFFRVHPRELLDRPFLASVITAPAPNALALEREWPAELSGLDYEHVLRQRAGKLLALAEERGHRTLLLGAWGCGVFRNDPELVADAFGRWLEGSRFAGSFDRVVFAVWDRKGTNTEAFVRRLGGS